MIFVTRKAHFSAAHRLFNESFSDIENEVVFDKCNTVHGHNYFIEITVKGNPTPETGYVVDLKKLAKIIDFEILSKVDHKTLNDISIFKNIIPTVENLCIVFWNILVDKLPSGELHSIKVFETDNNFAEYFG
ncbi:MAG: 6-carboxytetrahydropterin synthase [Chlorobiota bacterium]|jgi:6-pyruvoyltetrahydropterin/6-carboxytetrahydropterin synthase|nr:6-carboxytetrahydropterin synthase [Chlorobiota bacterium]QQS65440.1 MAG: 6-carboxytetrahydropterin synthase [Chlorobiota bacterium]